MSGRDVCILLVDDDPSTRRRHRWILEDAGYHVDEVAAGVDAAAALAELRPDLLLVDLVMPARSGWEVLGSLAKNPDLPDTPVVALTWSAAEENEMIARELGAAAYVVKPISSEDLLELVHRLLQRAVP